MITFLVPAALTVFELSVPADRLRRGITVLYIAGTAALLAAHPAQSINAIRGVPQALTDDRFASWTAGVRIPGGKVRAVWAGG